MAIYPIPPKTTNPQLRTNLFGRYNLAMKSPRIIAFLIVTISVVVSTASLAAPVTINLGDITPLYSTQGWGQLQVDHSVAGNPLRIGDQTYSRGLGTHAQSEIVYDLNRSYDRFEATVGIDAEMLAQPEASVIFKVLVDNVERFNSGLMRVDSKPQKVSVSLANASELRLIVTDGGDGIKCDHADWADATLTQTAAATSKPEAKYRVTTPDLTIGLTEQGEITEAVLGANKQKVDLAGAWRLLGCMETGKTTSRKLKGGGIEFTRALSHYIPNQQCRVTERYIPTGTSIRWEMEILGDAAPWTTPISLSLHWPKAADALFWAPWDDPEMEGIQWHDPLVTKPFENKTLWLGAPPVTTDPQVAVVYQGGDCLSIPMATVLDQKDDLALSLILSPEDTYLDTSLATGADGSIIFSHMNNRISSARLVKFAADLVVHPADWRAGLDWMVNRYPNYFNPPNPNADNIAGCGAYSTWEGDLDAARLKKMAFRVNWKASYDSPYCGMFIPPVKDDTETWPRFAADSAGNYTGDKSTTSIAQLEGYARKMRGYGFNVLSFFNVTEMGLGLSGVKYPDEKPGDPDLWRNPSAFVHANFEDAILRNEAGKTCSSWANQIVVDPATPSYRKHILEQARLHIEKIPSSSGICIDRMDWIRPYNPNADDGVTWRGGKPMRALTESWKSLMSEMGPLMHSHDKVIFGNALLKRIDLMKDLDGIYHEFGHQGANLNGTAFLCVRKPAMAWTPAANTLAPDPDAYFQRHLYMGVYPTAPFPGNDHTITPSPMAEKWYLDYGPLLDVMRGKKWVLEPHVLQTDVGKANIFEIPTGYAIPIAFAGKAEVATLTLRKPNGLKEWGKDLKAEALLPGSEEWVPVTAVVTGDTLELKASLKRGCAMVRISAGAKGS